MQTIKIDVGIGILTLDENQVTRMRGDRLFLEEAILLLLKYKSEAFEQDSECFKYLEEYLIERQYEENFIKNIFNNFKN
jgi:hypothetical protein